MKILFEHRNKITPRLSIILLDWSCRESFHTLDYLNDQTAPRDQYEIIWIEYYSRRPKEIDNKIKEYEKLGKLPILDKWMVMGIPNNVYYHKHLMYNVGLLASQGEIVVICDSDAIVRPTFIESIIKAFEDDPEIVLHMDEVRNVDRKFYPFNYPSVDDITGKGCINWINGKTTGILEKKDPLHARNYGACMCALRKDLIDIGGADEHIDFLGHICGPYEMTFRLMNNGKKEIWHEEEYLYHVWHPGTDGRGNYFGPHDGLNMSTTALDLLKDGRIMPLEKHHTPVVSADRTKKWKKDPVKNYLFWHLIRPSKDLLLKVELFLNMAPITIRQLYLKSKCNAGNKVMPKDFFLKVIMAFVFIKRMHGNNVYTIRTCHQVIRELRSKGVKEVVFYGAGNLTRILCILVREHNIEVKGIYDPLLAGNDEIKDYQGKIIVNYFNGINERIKDLQGLGIPRNNIVRLQ